MQRHHKNSKTQTSRASIHKAIRRDVLPPNLMKSRSREIGRYNDRFALKLDGHLGSTAAEMPVKFQSDCKSLNPNLVASRLNEILR